MICAWNNCGVEIDDKEGIKDHLEEHIRVAEEFKCQWAECNRTEPFGNRYALQIHARLHSGSKPYKCSKCQKEFSRGDALSKHTKRHEDEDKQNREQLSRLMHAFEERRAAEESAMELMDERQFHADCLRLLHDELLRQTELDGPEKERLWDEYL